jgi:hypothetical protein
MVLFLLKSYQGFGSTGVQGSQHGMLPSSMKPPSRRPLSMDADDTVQAEQQKPKIPVLEKHLIGQLSKEEQDALEVKFKEASEADKKVCSSVFLTHLLEMFQEPYSERFPQSLYYHYQYHLFPCSLWSYFFFKNHIAVVLHDSAGNGCNKITFNPKQKIVKMWKTEQIQNSMAPIWPIDVQNIVHMF